MNALLPNQFWKVTNIQSMLATCWDLFWNKSQKLYNHLINRLDHLTNRGWRRWFYWGGTTTTIAGAAILFSLLPYRGEGFPPAYVYWSFNAVAITMLAACGLRGAEKMREIGGLVNNEALK